MSSQGPSPWSPADVADLQALKRGSSSGRWFSYIAIACVVFAAFAGYAFLAPCVYKATAVVGMLPSSVPLPPARELAKRFHDAVVDGELLEQIARNGENVSEVVAAGGLPAAVEVSALDARTLIVSFSDPDPERAQNICNWIAKRIVRVSGSMVTPPPAAADATKPKPVKRLADQLTALLESSARPSTAQPPADSPSGPDLVVSVLQAERVKLSRRIDQLSASTNPYDAPELDSVKQRIGVLDRAIVSRRQALQQPGTTARSTPELEARLHELLRAAADTPEQAPAPAAGGGATVARVIVDAMLPTWPVQPNRRLVLLLGLAASLATSLAFAVARRESKRPVAEREQPRDVPVARVPPPSQAAPPPAARVTPAPQLLQTLVAPPTPRVTPAPPAPESTSTPPPLPSASAPATVRESTPPHLVTMAQTHVVEIPEQPQVVFETHVSPVEPEVQRIHPPRFYPPSITLITQPFGSPTAPLVPPTERIEVYTVVTPAEPEPSIPRPARRAFESSRPPPPDGPLRNSSVPIGSIRTTSRTATTQIFGKPSVQEVAPSGSTRDRARGDKLPLPDDSMRSPNARRSDRPSAPPPSVRPDDPGKAIPEDSPTTPGRSSPPPRVTARISPLDLSTRFRPDRSLSPAARGTLKDSILPHSQAAGFVVGVVSGSTSRKEKSRVAAELTLALTESGERRVLLVEGDAEEPSVQRLMGIEVPMSAGFSLQLETHVPGLAEPESWTVVHCSKWLDLLAEGLIRSDEALLTRKFRSCVLAIKDHYDIVVINGPLLTQESECQVLDGVADGIVIVGGRGEPSVQERAQKLLSPKCFTAVVAA